MVPVVCHVLYRSREVTWAMDGLLTICINLALTYLLFLWPPFQLFPCAGMHPAMKQIPPPHQKCRMVLKF